MRIGVTGASGMLGTAIVAHLSKLHKVFATSRSKGIEGKNVTWNCFDLTNAKTLNNWLVKIKPDVIIHCAAIVNIDFCEDNLALATKLHINTTEIISKYLDSTDGKLIYISTDSVFDGSKSRPYKESDSTNPLNVYAKTKLLGEIPVLSMNKGLVLRTNIVGSSRGERLSFSEWILKGLKENLALNLFYDVKFSPLSVYDLSMIIENIINNPIFGLYHCASSDSISKYHFGIKMADFFQLPVSMIKRVSVDDMEFKANRSKNMALDIKKISLALKYRFPNSVESIKSIQHQHSSN